MGPSASLRLRSLHSSLPSVGASHWSLRAQLPCSLSCSFHSAAARLWRSHFVSSNPTKNNLKQLHQKKLKIYSFIFLILFFISIFELSYNQLRHSIKLYCSKATNALYLLIPTLVLIPRILICFLPERIHLCYCYLLVF